MYIFNCILIPIFAFTFHRFRRWKPNKSHTTWPHEPHTFKWHSIVHMLRTWQDRWQLDCLWIASFLLFKVMPKWNSESKFHAAANKTNENLAIARVIKKTSQKAISSIAISTDCPKNGLLKEHCMATIQPVVFEKIQLHKKRKFFFEFQTTTYFRKKNGTRHPDFFRKSSFWRFPNYHFKAACNPTSSLPEKQIWKETNGKNILEFRSTINDKPRDKFETGHLWYCADFPCSLIPIDSWMPEWRKWGLCVHKNNFEKEKLRFSTENRQILLEKY